MPNEGGAHTAWSRVEVEALVADHLDMLLCELRGEPFNKASHNRALAARLHGRSRGSIERKHQNVSAVLIEHGLPWVEGYKPLRKYQRLLAEVVCAQVDARPELQAELEAVLRQPVVAPSPRDILAVEHEPPPLRDVFPDRVAERVAIDWRDRVGTRIDYFARESLNRGLGAAGEQFVVAFEQERLSRVGADHWAGQVEQVSRTRGDGLGFDVLSFEEDGRERLIEVKTTRFGKLTPFFVTANEVDVSSSEADRYQLYRVYRFGDSAPGGTTRGTQLFRKSGALEDGWSLDPLTFRARP